MIVSPGGVAEIDEGGPGDEIVFVEFGCAARSSSMARLRRAAVVASSAN